MRGLLRADQLVAASKHFLSYAVVDCYLPYRHSEELFLRDYLVASEREAILDDLFLRRASR